MTKNLSTLLKQIYFYPTNPRAYSGVQRLYKRTLKLRRNIGLVVTRNIVRNFIDSVQAYTLHRLIRNAFTQNHTYVSEIDKQCQAELAIMQTLSQGNRGFRYILTVINVLSKHALSVLVKKKLLRVYIKHL